MRILGLWMALTAAVLAATATPARADDTEGTLGIKVRTEPAALEPGGTGTLVIEATIPHDFHVYATDKGDQIPMTWKPIAAAGVTYRVKQAKLSAYEEYTEPVYGDKMDIWHDTFTVRVPIEIAADTAAGVELGALVSYAACTNESCWPPVKDQKAATKLVLASGAVAPGAAPGGAPGGGPPQPANPNVAAAPDPGKQAAYPGVQTGKGIKVTAEPDAAGKRILVTFTPEFGHHFYLPGIKDVDAYLLPIKVTPVESPGVTFGTFSIPRGDETHVAHEAVVVSVPIETTAEAGEAVLEVFWQVCTDGEAGTCFAPKTERLGVRVGSATAPDVGTAGGGDGPAGGQPEVEQGPKGAIVFPVVTNDSLKTKADNLIQRVYSEHGLLVLGLIFVLGAGLAFTPCVLPIIPITVAVVTGGRPDLPRKRLLSLLSVYVLSMALTFGAFGVVTALLGSTMSAAFQLPSVIWGIAGLFLVLAFGMLGVIEMQPPQWMTRMQGGVQQKGGSLVGAALLGCVMAFVASPCTGPFIVAMSVVLASGQNVALGFFMFTAMGLGMGAVLFAFGALNFALRPGPWMVWVRYSFGMLLLGGALYYVADPGYLQPPLLFVIGFAVALLAWLLVSRHLVKSEGETLGIANMRGAKVAVMFIVVTGLVALITKPAVLPDNVDKELVAFVHLRDVEHLKSIVAENIAAERPTVVDVWGTWCHNCKVFSRFIQEDARLRHEFSKVARLKIDVSKDNRADLRDALGIPRQPAPFFVFIDAQGRIRRGADLDAWEKPKKSKAALLERLKLVLGDAFGPKAMGHPFRVREEHAHR